MRLPSLVPVISLLFLLLIGFCFSKVHDDSNALRNLCCCASSCLLTSQDLITNQFLHYCPTGYTNLTNPHTNLTNPHTYCFQYHMHNPMKAICAGFGCMILKVGVVWVSFVRLPQKHCLQDVHWIGNTFSQIATLLPTSSIRSCITVIFNCFNCVCMNILVITSEHLQHSLFMSQWHSFGAKALCQVFLINTRQTLVCDSHWPVNPRKTFPYMLKATDW